jgi:hypothetical protein
VALRHLGKLVRRDGKPYLEVSNGGLVPVSRRRLSEVKSRTSGGQ